MKIEKFEDIIAWQKAQDFAVRIYATIDKMKDFIKLTYDFLTYDFLLSINPVASQS